MRTMIGCHFDFLQQTTLSMDQDFPDSSERCVTLHHAAIGRNTETGHVEGFLVAKKGVIDVDEIAQFLTFCQPSSPT